MLLYAVGMLFCVQRHRRRTTRRSAAHPCSPPPLAPRRHGALPLQPLPAAAAGGAHAEAGGAAAGGGACCAARRAGVGGDPGVHLQAEVACAAFRGMRCAAGGRAACNSRHQGPQLSRPTQPCTLVTLRPSRPVPPAVGPHRRERARPAVPPGAHPLHDSDGQAGGGACCRRSCRARCRRARCGPVGTRLCSVWRVRRSASPARDHALSAPAAATRAAHGGDGSQPVLALHRAVLFCSPTLEPPCEPSPGPTSTSTV